MAVSASSYEAKVSEAVVAMIAASAAFQTETGAANATEALAFIVEDSGGRDAKAVDGTAIDQAVACALISMGPMQSELRAVNTYGRSGDVAVLLSVPVDPTEDPDDQFRAARNLQGTVRAEIEALFGTSSSYLTAGTIESQQVEVTQPDTKNRQHLVCPLLISWRDVP